MIQDYNLRENTKRQEGGGHKVLVGCTQGGWGGGGRFRCVQTATWGVGGLEIGKNAYICNQWKAPTP